MIVTPTGGGCTRVHPYGMVDMSWGVIADGLPTDADGGVDV